ncbi:hypothetical protein [Corynebacterium sp. HS2168-gen11]|uniref:hypothetical protein n=1 Tax=Corynebacterium sp. HS2168-gen11 TaxID=2974027 RepID=UPI00216ACF9B|nr:hypothetical protein [Corynebacterium sp. HS2168-gen11]MCS4535426.1 hypothetical protein [Corynebacterium sp. HS2168-gen11]
MKVTNFTQARRIAFEALAAKYPFVKTNKRLGIGFYDKEGMESDEFYYAYPYEGPPHWYCPEGLPGCFVNKETGEARLVNSMDEADRFIKEYWDFTVYAEDD